MNVPATVTIGQTIYIVVGDMLNGGTAQTKSDRAEVGSFSDTERIGRLLFRSTLQMTGS